MRPVVVEWKKDGKNIFTTQIDIVVLVWCGKTPRIIVIFCGDTLSEKRKTIKTFCPNFVFYFQ